MPCCCNDPPQQQEVKLERDQLVEENEKLAEANKRYHLHTTELKDKVESLAVREPILL